MELTKTTVTINGATYKVATSSFWSDHSALFRSFDGGITWTHENNIYREFQNIYEDPDQLAALKILWPNYFK